MPWHPVDVPELAPQVIDIQTETVDDLDPILSDQAVIRYADQFWIELRHNGTRWVDNQPQIILQQADTWGMDLLNYPLTDIRNTWRRLANPLSYGLTRSYLLSAASAGATTLSVNSVSGFSTAGTTVPTLGQKISWTGKGASTLTGVTGVTLGLPDDTLIAQEGTSLVGGWGTAVIVQEYVGEMYAAGFEIEVRCSAFMNGSFDHRTFSVAPYYQQVDEAESYSALGITATGGLGFGPILTSDPDDYATARDGEREFHLHTLDEWTPLSFTPTKRFLFPALFGRMDHASANDTGEEYNYQLVHRMGERVRSDTSIAALGPGEYDSEVAQIVYGSSQRKLRWDVDAAKWFSPGEISITVRDLVRQRHTGTGTNWSYYSINENIGNAFLAGFWYQQIDMTPFGWMPQRILDANAAYSAGLVLQEKGTVTWWSWNAGSNFDLGIVYYPMDDGDWISPLIDPADYVSLTMPALPTVRSLRSFGWQDAVFPTPTAETLAPHLYTRYVSGTDAGVWLEACRLQWRWSGEP